MFLNEIVMFSKDQGGRNGRENKYNIVATNFNIFNLSYQRIFICGPAAGAFPLPTSFLMSVTPAACVRIYVSFGIFFICLSMYILTTYPVVMSVRSV